MIEYQSQHHVLIFLAMHLYNILEKKAGRAPAAATAGRVAAVVPTATAPIATTPLAAPVTAPTTAAAAVTANDLSNECYDKSQSLDAIQHLTLAIGLDCTNHVLYLDRSKAYWQMKSWACAAADARKVRISSISSFIPFLHLCL